MVTVTVVTAAAAAVVAVCLHGSVAAEALFASLTARYRMDSLSFPACHAACTFALLAMMTTTTTTTMTITATTTTTAHSTLVNRFTVFHCVSCSLHVRLTGSDDDDDDDDNDDNGDDNGDSS
jgi:hypothetical protein